MFRGYVKLWRKIYDNPLTKKPAYFTVWIFILSHVNHQDKFIIWNNKKTVVKRGSFITSAAKIAQGTGVPRGTVERILKYLENEVMIEEQTTRKFRLISVINYDDYNQNEEDNEEQVRNKRGTSEEQVDTTNNDKELIENEEEPLPPNGERPKKTHRNFLNQRREEQGRPPITPRKPTEKQIQFTEVCKTGIDYFKQKGYEDHGMQFMAVKDEKRNKTVRQLMINAYEKIGDLRPLIDWWFSGEGEFAGYEPEVCFSNRIIERFKNSDKIESTKKTFEVIS